MAVVVAANGRFIGYELYLIKICAFNILTKLFL